MPRIFPILLFSLIPATLWADRPNVLLICIDDLRPELGCYGADYIHSPNIDRLAEQGTLFTHHYVQAPTCGASRYSLLTGKYDRARKSNGALFARAKNLGNPPDEPSLPRHFKDHGYRTVSVGKVSHHPGGRGGRNWDDEARPEMPRAWDRHLQPTGPWRHPRGIMHGLANGEIRKRAKEMDVFQAVSGPDTTYPDGLIADTALAQLSTLAKGESPFFLAVGFIRPHLPFGAPKRYLDLYQGVSLPPIPHPEKPTGSTTWHRSGEFMKYNRWGRDPRQDGAFATAVRRHYAACVSYADAQVGKLLDSLEALDLDDQTIVVLWGDHGWHLGEHAVWGKHTLFEESLRSPLIIRRPGKPTGRRSPICETVDLFPTLCELSGVPMPGFGDGESLVPTIERPKGTGGSAIAYHGRFKTIRTATHRLITHANGSVELYDHRSSPDETINAATDQPDRVASLRKQLEARWAGQAKPEN